MPQEKKIYISSKALQKEGLRPEHAKVPRQKGAQERDFHSAVLAICVLLHQKLCYSCKVFRAKTQRETV